MTNEEFQKFAIEQFGLSMEQFRFAMEEFKEMRKFQKFAMEEFKENRKFQKLVMEKFDKIEKGQEEIIRDVNDFREEVKDGTEHTDKLISQGFQNINENMKRLGSVNK